MSSKRNDIVNFYFYYKGENNDKLVYLRVGTVVLNGILPLRMKKYEIKLLWSGQTICVAAGDPVYCGFNSV